VLAAFAFMGFVMVFSMFNREGYQFYIASSVLFFVLAYFIYATFIRAVSIPLKIYARWFYPVHEEVDDPDEDKLKNMLVISFEFQKKKEDQHYTNFRAKAPADMEFGQLFYYFLNDYNERHPNGKIEFLNEQSSPYGWIFYKKPRWYNLSTLIQINPSLSTTSGKMTLLCANGYKKNDYGYTTALHAGELGRRHENQ
jgi:Type VI secretion system, TssN